MQAFIRTIFSWPVPEAGSTVVWKLKYRFGRWFLTQFLLQIHISRWKEGVITSQTVYPVKTAVSPLSSPLVTFHQERCLGLSDRNSILMTKIIVYIIKPVNAHRAPNVICLILCFYRSILVTFCVLLQTSSVSEAQMLILKRNILHDYWLFCNASVDSSRLHLIFVIR